MDIPHQNGVLISDGLESSCDLLVKAIKAHEPEELRMVKMADSGTNIGLLVIVPGQIIAQAELLECLEREEQKIAQRRSFY